MTTPNPTRTFSSRAEALAALPDNQDGDVGTDLKSIVSSVPFTGQAGVWDDLQGSISQGVNPGASLIYEAYRDSPFKMYFWRHNLSDELNMSYQMSHSWLTSSAVRPHLHVVPMSSASGVFAVTGAYAWVGVSGTLGPALQWTGFLVTRSFTPADQYQHHIVSLGYIEPRVNSAVSDVLLIHLEREPTTDTYQTSKDSGTAAANVGLLSADTHYRKVELGTVDEIPVRP